MSHYETLGAAPGASPAEIKRAYYAAVKKNSPDRAPEKFKEIRAAYEALSDPESRARYDRLFAADAPDEIRRELLAAQGLMDGRRYKEAAQRLTAGRKPKYDNSELNLMLARASLSIGRTGTAAAVAKQILEAEPDNEGAALVLGACHERRGHVRVAEGHYKNWLEKKPGSHRMWASYLNHVSRSSRYLLPKETLRAMAAGTGNLSGCRHIFLIACSESLRWSDFWRNPDSKGLEDGLALLMGFVERIKSEPPEAGRPEPGKGPPNKREMMSALGCAAKLCRHRETRGGVIEGALPFLKGFPAFGLADEGLLEYLECMAQLHAMSGDAAVPGHFADFAEAVATRDPDGDEKDGLVAELAEKAAASPAASRIAIAAIKERYPAVYGCAPPHIWELAASGIKRARGFSGGAPEPYVRGAPKVGRNDPCPCGSGKKRKHCCG